MPFCKFCLLLEPPQLNNAVWHNCKRLNYVILSVDTCDDHREKAVEALSKFKSKKTDDTTK